MSPISVHEASEVPGGHGIAADNLAALPSAAGVYLFFGDREQTQLPLYIGKSINIRSRVLSHIREPAEARMMRQVQRVDWIRTAGEIGALLLESAWIKTRHPLYNQRLRRSRELCAWQLPDSLSAEPLANANASRPRLAKEWAPRLAFSRDVDFATTPGLFGLYSSTRAAQQALRELAPEHKLCLQALGLEAPSARGCFGRQVGRCSGVCVGQEPASAHFDKLRAALQDSQVQQWPFPGPVAIVESEADWVQRHIVHHWRHLGTLDNQGRWPIAYAPKKQGSIRSDAAFDLDAYRILMRPLMSGSSQVEALEA